ncbi:MAG: hypothetical protein ACSLFK_07950 [Gemmatimonadaceae bacterium]
MNDDNRIDESIRAAASDYNRPPATPRDEMWNAIQAAQKTAASGPALRIVAGGAAAGTARSGNAAPRSTPRFAWYGLAAAAVLLVATGVGIGRWTSSAPSPATIQVADAPSNSAPVVTGDGEVVREPGSERTPEPAPSTSTPASAASGDSRPSGPRTARTRDDIRRNPVVTGTGRLVAVSDGPPATPSTDGVELVSYQVATQQHLQDAETLLTSFTLESRDERMNARFAGWAKGLLSNTRLLLDSPAGEDPRRAKLLQDLELVLAQIVQLSPEAPAAEREIVQGSIQNGLVMTRLRSAIPAEQPREITERQ